MALNPNWLPGAETQPTLCSHLFKSKHRNAGEIMVFSFKNVNRWSLSTWQYFPSEGPDLLVRPQI